LSNQISMIPSMMSTHDLRSEFNKLSALRK
jgi:hypothetical protein